jgi:hypothetical protein
MYSLALIILKNVSKCFFSETTWTVETKLPGMIIGRSSTKCVFFMPIGNPRWPPPQGSRHFEFHIGTKNVKFVEDHPMNILYSLALIIFVVSEKKAFEHFPIGSKVCVFYADRKSKMATTTGHRLILDPMGKCSNAFFSETTNMIKAKLYMNVH